MGKSIINKLYINRIVLLDLAINPSRYEFIHNENSNNHNIIQEPRFHF